MESTQYREPWNKGKLVGQKPPLKPKDIWAIRIHLQNGARVRGLAMFNIAIDGKLRELTPLAWPRGFQTADLCPQAKIWQALTDSPRTAPKITVARASCQRRFKPAPDDVADCCKFLAGWPTKRNDIQAEQVDDAVPYRSCCAGADFCQFAGAGRRGGCDRRDGPIGRRRRLELRGHAALRRQGPGLLLRQLRACGSNRARGVVRLARFQSGLLRGADASRSGRALSSVISPSGAAGIRSGAWP